MALRYDTQFTSPSGLLYAEQSELEGGGITQPLTGIPTTFGIGVLADAISTSTDLTGLSTTFEINVATASAPAVSPTLQTLPITMVPGLVGATGDGQATTALAGIPITAGIGTFVDFSSQAVLESQPITYAQGPVTASASDGLSTSITQSLFVAPITFGIGAVSAGSQLGQSQALTGLEIGFTQGALTATGQGAPLLDRVVIRASARSITITERR